MAVKVADEAIQLHGRYGIPDEYDIAHYWRDAKVLEIVERTKEVEKMLIGKTILSRGHYLPIFLGHHTVQHNGSVCSCHCCPI